MSHSFKEAHREIRRLVGDDRRVCLEVEYWDQPSLKYASVGYTVTVFPTGPDDMDITGNLWQKSGSTLEEIVAVARGKFGTDRATLDDVSRQLAGGVS